MRVYVDDDDVINQLHDDDLIQEMENRGLKMPEQEDDEFYEDLDLLKDIYQKRRTGQDYQQELNMFIYSKLGKLI